MRATQLCGAHGTQSRTNLQLEYIGGWYFPTLPAAHTPNVSVAVEEPYRTPAWRATARRLGRRGKVARFSSPVEGITLPRPPHEQDLGEVYEAALLTTVGSQQIYGFLHHPAGEHKGSLEHVVSPARIGKRRRDDVGKFLDFMRTVSPVASQV